MAAQSPLSPADEKNLLLDILSPEIADNPYAFALYAYPWGKANTPLAQMDGPRNWQRDLMLEMAEYLHTCRVAQANKNPLPDFFRAAVASGRGPGKSALVGMIAHWFISTRIGGSVWVSANGEPQLRTKTFPEISKWVTMAINAHWFEINAMSIRPAKWFTERITASRSKGGLGKSSDYYYCSGQLWSEENPDAFAGAHNWDGEMYIFDEASGIPDPIWTVAEGVFTENIPDRFWLAFSNPRRNTGKFFECFHKNRDLWRHKQIDSRTVEGINVQTYQNIIDQNGPDSDEARIEVYGQFPNAGARQFVPMNLIDEATTREAHNDAGAPLLMGVDVARFGEDRSVIAFRRGRDAKSIPWETYRQLDTVQLASRVAEAAAKYQVDAIFVDGGGVGGGVIDTLKSMGLKCFEVQAGGSADDKDRYRNKRVEMWARMKEWLATGSIPDDKYLTDDLKAPEYEYDLKGVLALESKDKMKDRGLASPDMAEALAQTFARPVARKDAPYARGVQRQRRQAEEYNPFHFTS